MVVHQTFEPNAKNEYPRPNLYLCNVRRWKRGKQTDWWRNRFFKSVCFAESYFGKIVGKGRCKKRWRDYLLKSIRTETDEYWICESWRRCWLNKNAGIWIAAEKLHLEALFIMVREHRIKKESPNKGAKTEKGCLHQKSWWIKKGTITDSSVDTKLPYHRKIPV